MKSADAMTLTLALVAGALGTTTGRTQGFSSGSDGSYGPLNITASTNLNLPPDGVFKCTTITVAAGATLGFKRNALNTPVFLLATGDVTINGTISVGGGDSGGSPPVGGSGGPGGFDGGLPGLDASLIPPGAGYGPGAGKGGTASTSVDGAGAGGYGAKANGGTSTNHGGIYGSPLLVPLVGGSGGGGSTGSPGIGGGGGGGALLIASSTRISLANTGHLLALGGYSGGSAYSGGAGGALRLIAPVVAGNGELGVSGRNGGGHGRVRIDTLDRTGMNFVLNPVSSTSVGAAMFIFPNPLPRLDIIQAAGTNIPEGNPGPVVVVLPFGSSSSRTVTIQARDFNGIVPISLVLTPENGVPTTYLAQIDMGGGNPASTTINVVFPVNVRTILNAWTR